MRDNGCPLPTRRPGLGERQRRMLPSPSHRKAIEDDENYSFAAHAATLARRASHNKTRKRYGKGYNNMQARNNNSMPSFASMTNSQEYYYGGSQSNNDNNLHLLAGVCASPSSTTYTNNNDCLLTPRKRQTSNYNSSWPPSQRNKTSSTPDSQCCVSDHYVSKRRQQSKNIGYGDTIHQRTTVGRGEPTTDDENDSEDEYEYEYEYDSNDQPTPKMVRDDHDENNERGNSYRGMTMNSSDSPRTYQPPDCGGNVTLSCRVRSGKTG